MQPTLGMELFPLLQIGLLNGWILLAILVATEGIMILVFPQNKRGRLFEYDHSRWRKQHRVIFVIGKSFSLICIILIIFSPLRIGSPFFFLGLILYTLGLIGLVVALFNFRTTPVNRPVVHGFYRISRNPQVLTLFILISGICLAIGSWIALLIHILSATFNRVRILEEEKACLEQYGEPYQEYMVKVPRYLLIKTHMKEYSTDKAQQ